MVAAAVFQARSTYPYYYWSTRFRVPQYFPLEISTCHSWLEGNEMK
jgi:hypothetical protein